MEYSGTMLAQQDDNHNLLKNVADFQRTKPRTLEELQRGFRDTSDAVAFDLLGEKKCKVCFPGCRSACKTLGPMLKSDKEWW
jgi:hypothetical protein